MSDSYAGGPVVDLSMDPHAVPPELKKEGSDWFAVFNPGATKDGKRRLNVDLVHTLTHERQASTALEIRPRESKLFLSQRCVLCAVLCGRQVPCDWMQSDCSDLRHEDGSEDMVISYTLSRCAAL